MTTAFQTDLTDKGYNGWSNYETWNVSLWIQNDEGFYDIARRCDDYQDFVDAMEGFMSHTPDDVSFTSPELDTQELEDDHRTLIHGDLSKS